MTKLTRLTAGWLWRAGPGSLPAGRRPRLVNVLLRLELQVPEPVLGVLTDRLRLVVLLLLWLLLLQLMLLMMILLLLMLLLLLLLMLLLLLLL